MGGIPVVQDEQRLYGALYALRLMTRKYEFRDAEERIPLDNIVKTTFPTLLQVFQVHLSRDTYASLKTTCGLLLVS